MKHAFVKTCGKPCLRFMLRTSFPRTGKCETCFLILTSYACQKLLLPGTRFAMN